MRILLTITDISVVGGTERVVSNLANVFVQMGYEVEILSFFQRYEKIPYVLNERVSVSVFYKSLEEAAKPQRGVAKIFYKHFYKFVLSWQIRARYKNVDCVIVSEHIYVPFFKTRHTRYIKVFHSRFMGYRKRYKHFGTLVLLSSAEIARYTPYHNRVRVIPNFLPQIPTQTTDYAQRVVLSVGRLSEEKGFVRLIDIWEMVVKKLQTLSARRLGACDESENLHAKEMRALALSYCPPPLLENTQDSKGRESTAAIGVENSSKSFDLSLRDGVFGWQLHIVGDGAMREEIQARIESKGLQDSVILKPFTTNIAQEYLSASVYVMSSHYEGFGMVLIESASYGLPAIAFDIATGPSDIILDSHTGYLVADEDLEAYAGKLVELMSDKALRENLGRQAKERVVECFSKQAIIPLWEEILKP